MSSDSQPSALFADVESMPGKRNQRSGKRKQRSEDGDTILEAGHKTKLRKLCAAEHATEGPWLKGLAIAKPELQNNYQLGPEIAKGGFGQVYLIHSNNGGQDAACKVLPKLKDKAEHTLAQQKRHRYNTVLVRSLILQCTSATLLTCAKKFGPCPGGTSA